MATEYSESYSEVPVWNVTKDLVVDPQPITAISVLFAVLMSVVIVATVIGQ